MIDALDRELILRKEELNIPVQSIYFGGGTPSLLSAEELNRLIDTIFDHYAIAEDPEITLEANPDDLSQGKLTSLAKGRINRLSIGVQSFNNIDLRLMNRAHRSEGAEKCINMAKDLFRNISIDLIYGIPGMLLDDWKRNLEVFLSLDIQHLSAYALTVEPKTALNHFIEQGSVGRVDDKEYEKQYRILLDLMNENDYINYEFSNFGREGFFSMNNLNYWHGGNYMGVGPSAHSFDGNKRTWNVRNNIRYIQALSNDILPSESEFLSLRDKFNEHLMTGLRTMWGVSLEVINGSFGPEFKEHLILQAKVPMARELMKTEDGCLKITSKGKFLSDGLISDLFMVD
jgi:oxygen-independent coproporphyrinogen-3 oxidase